MLLPCCACTNHGVPSKGIWFDAVRLHLFEQPQGLFGAVSQKPGIKGMYPHPQGAFSAKRDRRVSSNNVETVLCGSRAERIKNLERKCYQKVSCNILFSAPAFHDGTAVCGAVQRQALVPVFCYFTQHCYGRVFFFFRIMTTTAP